MNRKDTLTIFVCETFIVKQEKTKIDSMIVGNIFVNDVRVSDILQILFSDVKLFSRPPTVSNSIINRRKAPLALKAMVLFI